MKSVPIEAKLQTFSITLPEATSVLLTGDFTDWRNRAIPMKRLPHGLWQASVALPPGPHHYQFIVDGERRDGLECVVPVPAMA